jgi:hypothetical protein
MDYWSALTLVKQVAGELGLPSPPSLVTDDPQVVQLVALLNSAGNELNLYYPWQQFTKFHDIHTVEGQDGYPLPNDWLYYIDQTQWDNTNSGPLTGPRSPQEWARLKTGLGAPAGMRYRVYQNKVMFLPIPKSPSTSLTIEYIKKNWIVRSDQSEIEIVTSDSDKIQYHPWLLIKFLRLKFYELKGFDTTASKADFMRMFLTLIGKDKGAPVLSLTPSAASGLIGSWQIPDGSWNVQ